MFEPNPAQTPELRLLCSSAAITVEITDNSWGTHKATNLSKFIKITSIIILTLLTIKQNNYHPNKQTSSPLLLPLQPMKVPIITSAFMGLPPLKAYALSGRPLCKKALIQMQEWGRIQTNPTPTINMNHIKKPLENTGFSRGLLISLIVAKLSLGELRCSSCCL